MTLAGVTGTRVEMFRTEDGSLAYFRYRRTLGLWWTLDGWGVVEMPKEAPATGGPYR
jgi:hypothetical protein